MDQNPTGSYCGWKQGAPERSSSATSALISVNSHELGKSVPLMFEDSDQFHDWFLIRAVGCMDRFMASKFRHPDIAPVSSAFSWISAVAYRSLASMRPRSGERCIA